jgi:ferrous iron transport protein B
LNFYIIIPVHNEEKYISQTLQSIVNQILKPKKLVVVNDNSSDNTGLIINDFVKRFDWIQKVENKSSNFHLPGTKTINAFYAGYEILDEDYDAAVLVVDVTNIERGLVFALELMELGIPFVIAANFWEEAEEKGIVIDYEGLEKDLGVPIVKINPLKKTGLRELLAAVDRASAGKIMVKYDDHIEEAISQLIVCLGSIETRLSRRGIAIRLLEGDEVVSSRYKCSILNEVREKLIAAGHDPYRDIEVTRAGYAYRLASGRVKFTTRRKNTIPWFDAIILRNPLLGLLTSLGTILIILAVTVVAGGILIDAISGFLDPIVDSIVTSLSTMGLWGLMAAKSIQALYAQYVAAVPYVFLFYFLLVILEDSGLLARMVIWLHSFTKRLGLHPKGVIPILLGLGCSVPATKATRIQPGVKQRIVAIAALAFVPCSSRASIIFGVAGRSLGAWAPIAIYVLGFTIAIIVIYFLSKLIRAYEETILIEDIPPLRRPTIRGILVKSWLKLEDFIIIVTPLIVAGAVIYAVLAYYHLDTAIVHPLAPIAAILHLPPKTLIPLIYGFLQKDLVIGMLAASLNTTNFLSVLTPHQIMTFTMASTYQVPCIIALGVMIKELGWRRALALWIGLDLLGFTITALYANAPLSP